MPVYKLDAGRVPIFWDLIKPGLILGRNISGVEGDWDFANRVLEQAICDKCTLWLGFHEGEVTGDNYVGFAITFTVVDQFTGGRDFVIYFLYTYRQANPGLRREAAQSLVKQAKKDGCRRILAYSDNAKLTAAIDDFLGGFVKKRTLFYVEMEDI